MTAHSPKLTDVFMPKDTPIATYIRRDNLKRPTTRTYPNGDIPALHSGIPATGV